MAPGLRESIITESTHVSFEGVFTQQPQPHGFLIPTSLTRIVVASNRAHVSLWYMLSCYSDIIPVCVCVLL